MAGLLPNSVKAELLNTKIELLGKLDFYKNNSRNNREALNKFLEDFSTDLVDAHESRPISRKIKYKNIEFSIELSRKDLLINNKVDVYFITTNRTDAKIYKNKTGKYYVTDRGNGEYFTCCREYNWSKVK